MLAMVCLVTYYIMVVAVVLDTTDFLVEQAVVVARVVALAETVPMVHMLLLQPWLA